MARSSIPHPTKRPKDGEEWAGYAIVWGVLAPILAGGLADVVAAYVIGSLTSHPPSATTSGVVAVLGAAAYYTFQGTFTWRFWFISYRNKTGNVTQRGRQNANNGGVNVKAAKNATVNVIPAHPPAKGAVKAMVSRADWGLQTPPANPTAVNVYARLSNRGGRVGVEHAALRFPGHDTFEHLYSQETPSGTHGPPVLDTGDVREYLFRFESKVKAELAGKKGTLEFGWTDGQTTRAEVVVRSA